MNNCIREISKTRCQSKAPLFCVPGIFGSPHYFTQLSRHIGLEQPFFSWQQTSSWENSFPLYRIETLASQYILNLKKIQSQPPYYLAGHSFGGLVAFEMARQLLLDNKKVAWVAIFDTAAPIISQKVKLTNFVNFANNLDYLNLIKEMFECTFGEIVEIHFQRNSNHTMTSFEHLFSRLDDIFPLLHPGDVIPKERIFSVFKNNWKAMCDYNPITIPQIPVVLYRATDRINGKLNHTLFSNQVINNPSYGWNELTDNIKVYQASGTHSTMLANPHVRCLATLLKSQLN
jgi:thioesterase domain-containing protein